MSTAAKAQNTEAKAKWLAATVGTTDIPWSDRPFQTMQNGSKLSGVSIAALYGAAAEGRLALKRLRGRTLIETASLISFLQDAEAWTPSGRTRQAVAKRVEEARASWANAS